MYYYKFGYSTYEYHEEITMLHEKLFTRLDLEFLTQDAYKYAYIKRKERIYAAEQSFYLEHFLSNGVTFADLFCDYDIDDSEYKSDFIEYLEQQGFQNIQYTEECWVFGWANADAEDDWHNDRSDLAKSIQLELSKIGRENVAI